MVEKYLTLGSLIREIREGVINYKCPMTDEEYNAKHCPLWCLFCDCDNPLNDNCSKRLEALSIKNV